jgi:hypothetical protein
MSGMWLGVIVALGAALATTIWWDTHRPLPPSEGRSASDAER